MPSETMQERAVKLIRLTWQNIGADALANEASNQFGYGINPHDINPATKDPDDPHYGYGCTYAESVTMDGESVREVALDCLRTSGTQEENEVITWIKELPYDESRALALQALPDDRYAY